MEQQDFVEPGPLTSESNSREPEPSAGRELARDVLQALCVAAVFACAGLALRLPYVREELFNIEHVRAQIQGMRWRGHLAFISVAMLVNAVGMPRLWVCAFAGTLYGAVTGATMGLAASLGGSTIDFYLARYALRPLLMRRMPERLKPWYDLFNRHGFRATLLIRLFPLANATVTNCLGGVSRVRFRDFITATFIGFIPLSIVFATFGSSAAKKSELQLALGSGLFVLVLLAQWFIARRTPRPDDVNS